MMNIRAFLLIISSLACSGCFLPRMAASVIGSDATRAKELGVAVKNFHDSLYWGSPAEAAVHVAPEMQESFQSDVLGAASEGKIVEFKIERMKFAPEDNTLAYVDTAVRYIRVPSYIVETARKRETWDYSHVGGEWVLTKVEDKDAAKKEPVDFTGQVR